MPPVGFEPTISAGQRPQTRKIIVIVITGSKVNYLFYLKDNHTDNNHHQILDAI